MAKVEKTCEGCGEKFIAFTLHQKISWQKLCDICKYKRQKDASRRNYYYKRKKQMAGTE